MANARIIKGRGVRDSKILVNNDYKYHLNNNSNTSLYWRCWRKDCRSRLRTNVFNLNDPAAVSHVNFLDVARSHGNFHFLFRECPDQYWPEYDVGRKAYRVMTFRPVVRRGSWLFWRPVFFWGVMIFLTAGKSICRPRILISIGHSLMIRIFGEFWKFWKILRENWV